VESVFALLVIVAVVAAGAGGLLALLFLNRRQGPVSQAQRSADPSTLVKRTRRKVHFRVGDVFPHTSEVAVFITQLCIARDHMMITQVLTGAEYAKPDDIGDPTTPPYLLYVAAGHLSEAGGILKSAEKSAEVSAFLMRISSEGKDSLKLLRKTLVRDDDSSLGKRIDKSRNLTFHYPWPQKITSALRRQRSQTGSIDYGDGGAMSVRYTFAADISARLIAKEWGTDEEEVAATLKEIAALLLAVFKLTSACMLRFLSETDGALGFEES